MWEGLQWCGACCRLLPRGSPNPEHQARPDTRGPLALLLVYTRPVVGSAWGLTVCELFLGVRGRQGASCPLCPLPEFQTAECHPNPRPAPVLGLRDSSGVGRGQVPTSMQPMEKTSCCGDRSWEPQV